MKLYINGTLKAKDGCSFDKNFIFLPSDVILTTDDGQVRITLSAQESECSFLKTTRKRKNRRFSCRLRGIDATIEKDGETRTVTDCSFADIAELLVENKMSLRNIEAYTDEDKTFEIKVDSISLYDGYLLMDLSECLNVNTYKETFN